MGDIVAFDSNKTTPEKALDNAKEMLEDGDRCVVSMIVRKDGEVMLVTSAITTERMYYLGGVLMNYALNGPI